MHHHAMTKLRLRIDFTPNGSLGPGKIRLLEAIRQTGSISAAARTMGMSYRRAWLLIDDLNRIFREPVVSAATGGKHGGGSELTEFGGTLITQYRAIEKDAFAAAAAGIDRLEKALRATPADAEGGSSTEEVAPTADSAASRTSLVRPLQR